MTAALTPFFFLQPYHYYVLSLVLITNKNISFTSSDILIIFLNPVLTLINAVLCNLGCSYSAAAVEMPFVFLGNRSRSVELVQVRLMSLSRAGMKALMDVKGTNCHELLQWRRWKQ